MDKSVGILKEIDSLGRIVIPKDYRDRLLLEGKVEVILTDRGVLVRNPEYVLVKQGETSRSAQSDDTDPIIKLTAGSI